MNNPDHIQVFNRSIEEANHWLDRLKETSNFADRHQAYSVLRGVLHVLRDRLPQHGIATLSGQMPLVLRGVLFEGWTAESKPVKLHANEFFEAVASQIKIERHMDGRTAARAVMELLRVQLGKDTTEKILHFLPTDLREALAVD